VDAYLDLIRAEEYTQARDRLLAIGRELGINMGPASLTV
jgi:hypothetical protein